MLLLLNVGGAGASRTFSAARRALDFEWAVASWLEEEGANFLVVAHWFGGLAAPLVAALRPVRAGALPHVDARRSPVATV